ncbi:glucosaminidase domain-containing protein [Vibrio sp. S4M6]|uniref:glucosaminidase domain-containing protein n=1 Tax=Vibrio sinus TaxID=2946865 RepID=UPI00202A2211|nr:glucosaminidase domain-containing protein [Vibrio sinus]MCL9783285.1 glucosaminidase domain-containing protein [Vibrio sinus]
MHNKGISILFFGVIAGFSLYLTHGYMNEPENEAEKADYSLGAVIADSPTTLSQSPEFNAISDVAERKRRFFEFLKKGVELENSRILKERARLGKMRNDFEQGDFSAEDQSYAVRLGRLYSVAVPATGVDIQWFDEMNHRVDVLPYALVLIQAANESAWGTSRFAREGNNYFGQWCYTSGCGLVPRGRPAGATYEVAKYNSVQQSIHAYFMNVNRNKAYEALRNIRFDLRQKHADLLSDQTALALTNGLIKYSQRGQAYVDDLQAMIKRNEQYWTQ